MDPHVVDFQLFSGVHVCEIQHVKMVILHHKSNTHDLDVFGQGYKEHKSWMPESFGGIPGKGRRGGSGRKAQV